MFQKPAFKVCRDAGIKMPLFVFNNVNKPEFLFHVMILSMKERIRIPFSEFTFTFSRSSGAGGQHINKVNSKVTLYWKIDESPSCPEAVKERFKAKYHRYLLESGEIQITSQANRSQKENIDDCIEKLHELINDVKNPPKTRKPTKPKRSAVLKRLESKKIDSEKKRLRKKDL
jgi:ribosome-associated protein